MSHSCIIYAKLSYTGIKMMLETSTNETSKERKRTQEIERHPILMNHQGSFTANDWQSGGISYHNSMTLFKEIEQDAILKYRVTQKTPK